MDLVGADAHTDGLTGRAGAGGMDEPLAALALHMHLEVDALEDDVIDLSLIHILSLTAHKFYGLNGIGLLLKRRRLALEPLIHGGESTTIYRSGTPTVALAASLETALNSAVNELPERSALSLIHI